MSRLVKASIPAFSGVLEEVLSTGDRCLIFEYDEGYEIRLFEDLEALIPRYVEDSLDPETLNEANTTANDLSSAAQALGSLDAVKQQLGL